MSGGYRPIAILRGGLALGVACALCAAGFLLLRRFPGGGTPMAGSDSAPTSSQISGAPAADWCAPDYGPIPGGGCLAIDATAPGAQQLVVYLHGRYARTAAGEELSRQQRLAKRAMKRGFAVLALRGRLGACTAPELADWYCWPSNEHNAASADEIVASWADTLAAAAVRSRSPKRFLLGFSNGGYFAGLIASRGLLGADAVVVAHGGPVEPVHAANARPPLLLLSADDDVAQDEMIRYDRELAREGWSHDSYARSGGHALSDEDIDTALTFFSRAGEPLPLVPPLPLHRPVFHVRDAGESLAVESGSELPDEPLDSDDTPAEISDDDY